WSRSPPTSSATTRRRPVSWRRAGFRRRASFAGTSSRTAGSLMRGCSACSSRGHDMPWKVVERKVGRAGGLNGTGHFQFGHRSGAIRSGEKYPRAWRNILADLGRSADVLTGFHFQGALLRLAPAGPLLLAPDHTPPQHYGPHLQGA